MGWFDDIWGGDSINSAGRQVMKNIDEGRTMNKPIKITNPPDYSGIVNKYIDEHSRSVDESHQDHKNSTGQLPDVED